MLSHQSDCSGKVNCTMRNHQIATFQTFLAPRLTLLYCTCTGGWTAIYKLAPVFDESSGRARKILSGDERVQTLFFDKAAGRARKIWCQGTRLILPRTRTWEQG